ncbi:MAG: hypothetical protein ACXWWN_01000 [Gemmatimonadales bacterium]
MSLSASDNDTFDPERVGTEFPDTTNQVAVWYRWDGADSGKKVGIRWSKNGEVVLEQGDTLAKVSGASAYVLKMAAGSKLPVGDYQVELLEDGVAVTKIPFKVGSGTEPMKASTAGATAAASEETETAAAATGSGGFPAAQPTKWPGVTVQVTELARKGKNLNAKLRFINSGTERPRPAFYYADTYAIDANNQKYEVLEDDKGRYLGSLGTGYFNWWGEYLDPGATVVVWMRFPAPSAGVKAVTIQLDGMDPIEDVRIGN